MQAATCVRWRGVCPGSARAPCTPRPQRIPLGPCSPRPDTAASPPCLRLSGIPSRGWRSLCSRCSYCPRHPASPSRSRSSGGAALRCECAGTRTRTSWRTYLGRQQESIRKQRWFFCNVEPREKGDDCKKKLQEFETLFPVFKIWGVLPYILYFVAYCLEMKPLKKNLKWSL